MSAPSPRSTGVLAQGLWPQGCGTATGTAARGRLPANRATSKVYFTSGIPGRRGRAGKRGACRQKLTARGTLRAGDGRRCQAPSILSKRKQSVSSHLSASPPQAPRSRVSPHRKAAGAWRAHTPPPHCHHRGAEINVAENGRGRQAVSNESFIIHRGGDDFQFRLSRYFAGASRARRARQLPLPREAERAPLFNARPTGLPTGVREEADNDNGECTAAVLTVCYAARLGTPAAQLAGCRATAR